MSADLARMEGVRFLAASGTPVSAALAKMPRLTLPPMCVAVSAAALRDWVEQAAVGGEIVYAQGAVLDRGHEAVALARQLAGEGRVTLCLKRCEGGFKFMAQKLPERAQAAPRVTGGVPLPPHEDTMLGACLAILSRAADAGQHCPSHAAVARALGLKSADKARYLQRKLEDEGHISVSRTGDFRCVTIMGSGRSTRGEGK